MPFPGCETFGPGVPTLKVRRLDGPVKQKQKPYRDHFLNQLHSIRVLVHLELSSQLVDLLFHLLFAIS